MTATKLKIRILFNKPTDYQKVFWESEVPARNGYWGYVRKASDYNDLKEQVSALIGGLVSELIAAGTAIETLPPIEIRNVDDVMSLFDELRSADVNILLPIFTMVNTDWGNLVYAVNAASENMLIFDQFDPYTYAGTLYTPLALNHMRDFKIDRHVFVSEGSTEKVASSLRSLFALKAISEANLVCVGPVHADFGGWGALKKAQELFGWKTHFITISRFVADFNRYIEDPEKRAKALAASSAYRSNARTVTDVQDDDFIRSGIFEMVLKSYLDEVDGNWVTVNYYNAQIMHGTGTSCCMAYSRLNDSGTTVATCEADVGAMLLQFIMRHLASKPAFLVDPTVNEGTSTLVLAHCTSPLKMLGFDREALPYAVRPCHDTGTGASPKPEYAPGTVTIAGLSFDISEMMIISGEVLGSPDFRICHAQMEVSIRNPTEILHAWKGFHWIVVYGDVTAERETVCRVKGIKADVHR